LVWHKQKDRYFAFALAGVEAVVLIFLIENMVYPTVGIFAASFAASLQYRLMNSQIARPYLSGLFITLLMFYCWSHLILHPERKFYPIYRILLLPVPEHKNHYFSFLFALITGIFAFSSSSENVYGISHQWRHCFPLFLPHWTKPRLIFVQGIERWLGKPSPDFLIEYLSLSLSSLNLSYFISFSYHNLRHIYIKNKFFLLAKISSLFHSFLSSNSYWLSLFNIH
jgi:hypothetical protein